MKSFVKRLLLVIIALVVILFIYDLYNSQKDIWFEDARSIKSTIEVLENSLNNKGEFFEGFVTLMPGLSKVELVEQGEDYVFIKTNEGLMKRTNISIQSEDGMIKIEFDEEYQAGSAITATSHFIEEFTQKDDGLVLKLKIMDLKSPGFIGFFYRNFGSNNIGNAMLDSYKQYLEKLNN